MTLPGESGPFTFVLPRAAAVAGRVIDVGGAPAANATVLMSRPTGQGPWAEDVEPVECGPQGEFRFEEMAPGDMGSDVLDDDPLVADLEHICREFSKDRRIGPDDNLFEVGVSSLTLTEIVLAVEEKYPGKLDISDLFDYPTLRDIAAFLQKDA